MNSELALFEYLGSAGVGARIATDPSLSARVSDALGRVRWGLNVCCFIMCMSVIHLLCRQCPMSA